MKMRNCYLLWLYLGLTSWLGVNADNEHEIKRHEIKRGVFPYMAFIYYSDPSVVDMSGERFIRSALLIRPDWLVTTALGPSVIGTPDGFPKKTLLVRAGSIIIDANFTLNEDEYEQEREVIQVVRPYNYSATQWWTTDISLMKTLLPFNMTSAVGVKNLNVQYDFKNAKTCSILVYTKRYNRTDEKFLMLLFVELLPPSIENCGSHFTASTMVCANDSNENKAAAYDPEFCHGNSGGPLICQQEVMGLQTYIGNDCKQPHLYQLLSAWDNFITCAIEGKCQEEQCGKICDVTYKDPINIPITPLAANDAVALVSAPLVTDKMSATKQISITSSSEDTDILTQSVEQTSEQRATVASSTTNPPLLEPMSNRETTEPRTDNIESKSWPSEARLGPKRIWNHSKEFNDDLDESDREASVEAQQQGKDRRNSSDRIICGIHTLVFGIVLLVCM